MSNSLEGAHRPGHGQGSHIFWGILSVIFAAASCYFFWQNRANELDARTSKDQITLLQDENRQLKAQIDKLQSATAQFDVMLKNREEKLKEQATSLAQVTEKTQQLDAERQEAERQKKARADAAEKWRASLQTLADGSGVALIERKDIPTLRINNASLFVPGEMTVSPAAQELLRKMAILVAPQLKDHALRLESFTDNDPITGPLKSKYPTNFELSTARATTVARFLTEQAKLPNDRITVVGRGDQYPIASNDTKEGRAQNRRLELFLEPLDLAAPPATGQ